MRKKVHGASLFTYHNNDGTDDQVVLELDVLTAIRNAEVLLADYYKSVSGLINGYAQKGNKVPQGVAIGVFQAIAPVWKDLEGFLRAKGFNDRDGILIREKLIKESERLTVQLIADKEEKGLKEPSKELNKKLVAEFKRKYQKDIILGFPAQAQDAAQVQYMRQKLVRYSDDVLIDWRDIVFSNYTGSNQSLRTDRSITPAKTKSDSGTSSKEDRTTGMATGLGYWSDNSYHNLFNVDFAGRDIRKETAADYFTKAGLQDILKVNAYCTVGDLRKYYDEWEDSVEGDRPKLKFKHTTGSEVVTINPYAATSDVRKYTNSSLESALKSSSKLMLTSGVTEIGDLRLYIPPSSISVYQQSQVYTVEALRMAGNPKLLNHAPVVKIDLSFYINGSDRINNDLRKLIAQFKQTPFTTLRNTTAFNGLVEQLIKNGMMPRPEEGEQFDELAPIPVVLESISINTIPSFPDLLMVHVSLPVFNHKPFVKEFKFWSKSDAAGDSALYSMYRNSLTYYQTDIKEDGISALDANGYKVYIKTPNQVSAAAVTIDPAESNAYVKTYSSIIEGVTDNAKYATTSNNLLRKYPLARYNDYLSLKYYSLGSANLRVLYFQQLLTSLRSTINAIVDVGQLAIADEFSFEKVKVKIGYGAQLSAIIHDFREAMALVTQLKMAAVSLKDINFNYSDSRELIGEDSIYLKDTDLGSITVADAFERLITQYEKASESGQKKKLELAILGITARAIEEIYRKSTNYSSSVISAKTLNLGWKSSAVAALDSREDDKTLDFSEAITGISLSYRNKLVSMPVIGHSLPTYQHMGHGEWDVSLDIKTTDEVLLRYLEDIQSSSGTIMKDRLQKRDGFKHINYRIEVANPGNLLRTVGITYLAMKSFNFTNIEGYPGWYSANIDFVEDDVDIDEFGSLEVYRSASRTDLNRIANAFFPLGSTDSEGSSNINHSELLFEEYVRHLIANTVDDDGRRLYDYLLVNKSLDDNGNAITNWMGDQWNWGVDPQGMLEGRTPNGTINYKDPVTGKFSKVGDLFAARSYEITTSKSEIVQLSSPPYDGHSSWSVTFYTSGNADKTKINKVLTDFVNNEIIKPINETYSIIVAFLEKIDGSISVASYNDVTGIYARYVMLVADYFVSTTSLDKSEITRYVKTIYTKVDAEAKGSSDTKNEAGGQFSDLNMLTPFNPLFDNKRSSLSKLFIFKPYMTLLNKALKSDSIPRIAPENVYDRVAQGIGYTDDLLSKIRSNSGAYLLNNYPDFEFPYVSSGQTGSNIFGPAFPYVDQPTDESLRDEYGIVDDFAQQATIYLTSLTGSLTAKDLDNDETRKSMDNFLVTLKEYAGSPEASALFTSEARNSIPSSVDALKKDLDIIAEFLKEKEKKSKDDPDTIKLKATKYDMLKMIRARAITRWYSVNKTLSPNQDHIVVSVDYTFTDKEKKVVDPTKIKYKLMRKDDSTGKYSRLSEKELSEVTSEYVLKDRGKSTTSKGHEADTDEYIKNNGIMTREEYLDYAIQAFKEMIQICNVSDAESTAFTNFLGFTDSDSVTTRQELRQKLVTAKSRNYEGSMYRAFPAIKIFFIKEDNPDWVLFDDFYNYNAVVSVDVIDSKHSASQTAVIRLNNMTNKLSSNDGSELLTDFDTAYSFDSMMIRVGAPIIIKGGYGPDQSSLPVLFNGAVTQIQPGEIMEITCQSWGVELTNPVDTARDGMSFGSLSPERSMGAAILKILSGTKGLSHFGRWSPGLLDEHRYSTVEAERAYFATWLPTFDFIADLVVDDKKDASAIKRFINTAGNIAENVNSGLLNWGNPLYDNIYLPAMQENSFHFWKYATYNITNFWSDSGKFVWHIFNQNIWDALNEMALFQGDYVVRTLPYNEHVLDVQAQPRMTLYFGPRDGYYKALDNTNLSDPKYNTISPDYIKSILINASLNEDDENYSEDPDFNDPKYVNIYRNSPSLSSFKQELIRQYKGLVITADDYDSPSKWDWFTTHMFSDPELNHKVKAIEMLAYGGLEKSMAKLGELARYSREEEIELAIDFDKIINDPEKSFYDEYSYFTRFDLFNKDKWNPSKVHDRYELPELVVNILVKYGATGFWRSLDTVVDASVGFHDTASDYLAEMLRFAEIAYNLDNWLIDDIANIVSNTATSNSRPYALSDANMRSWLMKTDVFKEAFDTADKMGKNDKYMYRPVVQYHFANSYEHIIDNQIIATADNMYNRVELLFPTEPNIDSLQRNVAEDNVRRHTVQLNPYLDTNYTRTYTSYQKNLRLGLFVDWANRGSYADPEKYDSRSALPAYSNIANQVLMNVAKPMYQGNLTMVGNPSIKPWHIVFIYDNVNQMTGPVEVEQVVHSFNAQSGYTTTIVPNAVMEHRNLKSVWDTQYLGQMGGIDTANWLIHAIGDGISGAIKTAGIGIAAGGTATLLGISNPVGAIAATVAGVYYLGSTTFTAIESNYVGKMCRAATLGGWMPLTILPLSYQGKPYLAGLEGAYWGGDTYSFLLGQIGAQAKGAIGLDPMVISDYVLPSNTLKVK
ncbi:hypothetical protein [Acinetobacter sp.]|uniref:hypothetical protein n=1 Tax=Acinetobacter sp. TaxID=472 RepID=UPI003CFF029C